MKTLIALLTIFLLSGCAVSPDSKVGQAQNRINYLVNEFGRQYCMADEFGRKIIRQRLNEKLEGFEIKLICENDILTIQYYI